MRVTNMKNAISNTHLLVATMVAVALLLAPAAFAAAPGIKGSTFNLVASAEYLTQPDGSSVYSWGYGCTDNGGGNFFPSNIPNAGCTTMQIPGPTLIVTQGQTVTVNLTNNLPTAAGNTSILFPGFNVTASGSGTPQGV